MKLYDETIQKCIALLNTGESRPLPTDGGDWPEVSDRSMILRSDMAYELGGEGLPAVGCTLVTAEKSLCSADALTLLGPDLPEIKRDIPFARIAIVRVTPDTMGEGQALYNAIRALEYTRYHFYPEGFMMRVSSTRHKESVRIGKNALAKGLSFAKAGSRMISAFRKNSRVEAVRLFYVTLESFDYRALERCAAEAEAITKTIDHILKNAVMDCGACSLQTVCNEVEGLRELHFAL